MDKPMPPTYPPKQERMPTLYLVMDDRNKMVRLVCKHDGVLVQGQFIEFRTTVCTLPFEKLGEYGLGISYK